jgi:hypothetical protein
MALICSIRAEFGQSEAFEAPGNLASHLDF